MPHFILLLLRPITCTEKQLWRERVGRNVTQFYFVFINPTLKIQDIMKFTNNEKKPSFHQVVNVIFVGSLRKSHS